MPFRQKFLVPDFTDPNVPRVFDDPMISLGTLMLIDFAHSLTTLPAPGNVPASGSKLTNLAADRAAAVIGGITDLSTLNPTFTQVGLTGSSGKVERTGKGALHVICSQGNLGAGHGVMIEYPDPIKSFLLAHPNAWPVATLVRRITRAAIPSGSDIIRHSVFSNNVGIASRYLLQMLTNSTGVTSYPPNSQSTYLGRTLITPGAGATGPELNDQAANGWVGTLPTLATFRAGVYIGDVPDATPAIQQKHSSSVIYRIGLEILFAPSGTPSGYAGFTGRSFTDYATASQAWYTKNMLTAGGRFFGDTFTDPATIP